MKVVPASVAGAFHTSLMQPAVSGLQAGSAETDVSDTTIPVFSNVDAKAHQKADEIRELLPRQVVSPVLWEDSIRAMIGAGIEKFVEVRDWPSPARNAETNRPQTRGRWLQATSKLN